MVTEGKLKSLILCQSWLQSIQKLLLTWLKHLLFLHWQAGGSALIHILYRTDRKLIYRLPRSNKTQTDDWFLMPHCGVCVAQELQAGGEVGTEELVDREVGGGGDKRGQRGGSTVLGPHGRDSSKTCLRWPQTGLNRTGPLGGGAWQWRQQAAVGPFPHWLFSPLAFLYTSQGEEDN